MTFFNEAGQIISAAEWLRRYEAYYFLGGSVSGRVNRLNQSSRFVEDRVCALLNQSTMLSKDDLVLLMAWKMGLINHSSSEALKKIIYKQKFDESLISKRYRTLDFSKSIPYLAAKMPQIAQMLSQDPEYLVDWVRGSHPELKSFGITYILTVQFFITHGNDPIYDRFAHAGAIAIHQGLKTGSAIKPAPVQDWSEYQGYVDLLKPISAACFQSGINLQMTVPRPVDRALWVYGHFFQEMKPTQSSSFLRTALIEPTAQGRMCRGTRTVYCSIDSMGQLYADGRTRVVLAVRTECMNYSPKIRLTDGRVPITLSTPKGDFDAGIRAWSTASDRPYVCPNLRGRGTSEKTTLAIVLENCGISMNAVVKVAITGNTWNMVV